MDIGGFDTKIEGWGKEDVDLFEKVKLTSGEFLFELLFSRRSKMADFVLSGHRSPGSYTSTTRFTATRTCRQHRRTCATARRPPVSLPSTLSSIRSLSTRDPSCAPSNPFFHSNTRRPIVPGTSDSLPRNIFSLLTSPILLHPSFHFPGLFYYYSQ